MLGFLSKRTHRSDLSLVVPIVFSGVATEMRQNFYDAAYSYLDEWIRKDSNFHRILAYEKRSETLAMNGIGCLVEVAKYYSVIRTLKITAKSNGLAAAYEALCMLEPPDDTNVVEAVEGFATKLQTVYGVFALPAASKFLWMRFRCPIVIYDKLASEWLKINGGYADNGYFAYRENGRINSKNMISRSVKLAQSQSR